MNIETVNIEMLKLKLKSVFWDYTISEEELLGILFSGQAVKGIGVNILKIKLLNSYQWYTLVEMLGIENAKLLLDKKVIEGLFPRVLREKYVHASRILSR